MCMTLWTSQSVGRQGSKTLATYSSAVMVSDMQPSSLTALNCSWSLTTQNFSRSWWNCVMTISATQAVTNYQELPDFSFLWNASIWVAVVRAEAGMVPIGTHTFSVLSLGTYSMPLSTSCKGKGQPCGCTAGHSWAQHKHGGGALLVCFYTLNLWTKNVT